MFEKIYFVKQQIKKIGEYRKLLKFNERRNTAISMGTKKEHFLEPFLGYTLTATLPKDISLVINHNLITALHIYYNRLRETNRYHLGYKEKDDMYLSPEVCATIDKKMEEAYKKEFINA